MIPLTFAMVIASTGNGYLLARVGRYRAFALGGFGLGAIGLFVLSTLRTDASLVVIMLLMVVLGTSIGFVGPTLTLASQSAARPGEIGVVTSLLQFARQLGSTVGTAVFGTVLTLRFMPEMQSVLPPELLPHLEGQLLEAVSDPQALLLPEATNRRPAQPGGDLQHRPEAVVRVSTPIRGGLAASLHWVFLAGSAVFGSGVVAALFLRDRPAAGSGRNSAHAGPVVQPAARLDLRPGAG